MKAFQFNVTILRIPWIRKNVNTDVLRDLLAFKPYLVLESEVLNLGYISHHSALGTTVTEDESHLVYQNMAANNNNI